MPKRPPAVARVLERVTATARRYQMLEPGRRVLVACSGGPDSVCLLHSLVRLRRLFRIRLEVFHFDHRLREGSTRDAAYVRRLATRLELPVVVHEAIDRPRRGQSIEAWARMARYAALCQAAIDREADMAALGHTLDDQAETVLLGLVRGGGLDAAAGMAPVTALPPLGVRGVRPLLGVTRVEVETFNRSLGVRARRDPMNRDPAFLRNRIRLEVLPVLEGRLDRGVKATLARTAENVRADAEFLDALASEASSRVATMSGEEIRLDARTLASLPTPIALRVVHETLRLAGAMGGEWPADVETPHIRAVLDLAGGRPGRRVDLPGLVANRTRDGVHVAPKSSRRRLSARRKGRPIGS
ncbi:MAG: tRNA lysidine(34) synthetase TilS [Actinomycetota bacterium]